MYDIVLGSVIRKMWISVKSVQMYNLFIKFALIFSFNKNNFLQRNFFIFHLTRQMMLKIEFFLFASIDHKRGETLSLWLLQSASYC